jgi:hypothetical protein
MGVGTGQSRLVHVAKVHEVRVSLWPEAMVAQCEQRNIYLL